MQSTHGWVKLISVTALALAMVAGQLALARPAAAHGDEVDIAVTALVPDPQRPLLRLYRVSVLYAGDREPVRRATVVLSGRREDGAASVPEFKLTEVADAEGVYVGEVVFSRFGAWELSLGVRASLGQGSGQASFIEQVRPGALEANQEAALRAEAERVVRLQVFFGFDWWPDAVTLAMRILHSLAGLSYFALVGLAFTIAWFGVPSERPRLPRQLARAFIPGAGASLTLLLGAGLYSAYFDAPIAPPGVYDISSMRRIPYGDLYLFAFAIKLLLFVALAGTAIRMGRALKAWSESVPGERAGRAVAALRRDTLASAAIGLSLAADVALLIYLHYLSHLGAFLPAQ